MAPSLLLPFLFLLSFSSSTAFHFPSYPPHRTLIQVQQQPLILPYHHGLLLKGNLSLHLLWYGTFSPSQRASISDFLLSLSPPSPPPPPSPSSWWSTISSYNAAPTTINIVTQTLDSSYSLSRSLTSSSLRRLARRAAPSPTQTSIVAIFTSDDVAVDGFCISACGFHSAARNKSKVKFPFLWVGNAAAQCPGQCAWPYALPAYGPPSASPLVPPSGDVGVEGMVINLATLLAGAVTNPYGGGFFQGPAAAPLEAVTACTGIFGSGAYPGYAGKVLVDGGTGASYNARGVRGREFLLPAMWDPKTFSCATLV